MPANRLCIDRLAGREPAAAGPQRTLFERERRFPGCVENTFNALARVTPSHLMDAALFDFKGLQPTGVADADGDIAFDEEPCGEPAPVAGVIRFAEP